MKHNGFMIYIVSFVIILYPPLIYFLSMINIDFSTSFIEWMSAALIDLVLVFITTFIINRYVKMTFKRSLEHDEKKHILFGLIANVLMFLYVYQFIMNIDQIVSIFTLTLVLILSYKWLISNTILFKETFILGILFGLFDLFLIIFTGNTLLDQINSLSSLQGTLFQIGFMILFFSSIGYYIFALMSKHEWTLTRYAMTIFISIGVLLVYFLNTQEELISTMFVFAFFVFLVDVIMRIVTKAFKITDIAYYLRIILITSLFLISYEIELFLFQQFDVSQMGFFIAIFYVTAASEIITIITPKKHTRSIFISPLDYLKFYYRSVLSRYKDVSLLTDMDTVFVDINELARSVISLDSKESSLVVIQSNHPSFIDETLKHINHPHICILTERELGIDYSNLFVAHDILIYSINQKTSE